MKGKYRIIIQNKKIKYDFEIRRNITVIRGDSATGKTALVDMIREYYEEGEDSGIDMRCEKTCVVLEGKNWESQLADIKDSIVFMDEGNRFVATKEFASVIQKTDNYYVIVTRERLASLPYSVNEIYGIRNSGKYGKLKQTYNEMYRIYTSDMFEQSVWPEVIITEDSNAGYQFFTDVCKKNGLICESAGGKSNIFHKMESHKEEAVLIVADGAAFGPEMERAMKLAEIHKKITLYLPESFEWIILNSEAVKDHEIEKILEEPAEYIVSQEYFSWERYFTQLLIRKTDGTYLKYSKNSLNPSYLQENVEKKVLEVMEKIDFLWKK